MEGTQTFLKTDSGTVLNLIISLKKSICEHWAHIYFFCMLKMCLKVSVSHKVHQLHMLYLYLSLFLTLSLLLAQLWESLKVLRNTNVDWR